MLFSDLKTEVATLLIDAPAAVQNLSGSWVNRAIRKLQQKHGFKIMEAVADFTTVISTRALGNVPSDWKQARGKPYYTRDSGSTEEMFYIEEKREAVIRYGDNADLYFGHPRALVENNELTPQFEVYPFPDGNADYSDGEYRIVVPYWKYLPVLTNDGDSNWFTNNAEQWIIYQAVAEGFYANEDEDRAETWERRAMREFKDVKLADKMRRLANTQVLAAHKGARSPHTQE